MNEITVVIEEKKYWYAIFIDASQTFEKVWHEGVLHKMKQSLPLKSYSSGSILRSKTKIKPHSWNPPDMKFYKVASGAY